MIDDLKKNMLVKGYWQYDRKNLDIYGITNSLFLKSLPKNFDKINNFGDIWITINTHCFITLFYA